MPIININDAEPQRPAKRTRPASFATAPGMNDDLRKRPVYTCPELGRTCTRPGAYDAFEHPSIYAGVRLPYRFSQGLPGTNVVDIPGELLS